MTKTKFTEDMQVRQIKGANVGAIGTVTRVIEPTQFFSDGTAGNGQIRVTFAGIRYGQVEYSYSSADRFIEIA